MSRKLKKLILVFLNLNTLFILFSVVTSGYWPDTVRAQQPGNVTLQASIGFEESLKPETWIPVRVHLENNGPGMQGYVQVNFLDVEDKSLYRYPVELPNGAKKELTLYIFAPNYAYEAEVAFYSGQQRQANQKLQINMRTSSDRLVGIAAETPSSFNLLNLIDPPYGDAYTVEINLQKLPAFGLALESLDAILISNTDSNVLSQAQVQALDAWVANGGRLIIFGGPEWRKATSGFAQLNLLPFLPNETRLVQDWSAFSSIAAGQPAPSGQGVAATGDLSSGARVLAATDHDLPLIVQQPIGAGEVIFFTIDPTLAPLNSWPGMESIYRYILERPLPNPPWQNGIKDWYSASNAAQSLPNLNLPPAVLVCGFLVIYLLVLGPVNYLIVRKLKRRELGWFTTPGLIVIFSLIVLVSGGLSRSRQPILNRLSVVQIWPGAPLARLDGILGIYSPYRSTYRLDFEGNIQAHGLPTSMSPTNRGMVFYQNTDSGYLTDLRVEVSSIQTVILEGLIQAPAFKGILTISIDGNGAQVSGSVTNSSEITLEDAVLITSGGTVKLGTFLPGETREIQQALIRNRTQLPSLPGVYPARPVYSPAGPINFAAYFSGNIYPLEEIVGTSNFYDSREVYRKYSLVSSFISNSDPVTSLGNEIFLSGWSKQPVQPAILHGINSVSQDVTLVLVRFDPTIVTSGDEIKITPEFFSWTPLDTQSASFSPYQLYFYGAEVFEYGYKPILPLNFGNVSKLILHLEVSGITGPISEVTVYLWNDRAADWEEMPMLNWGENLINDPQRFVQPDGTIQLQLHGTGQYLDITRADFTLFTLTVTK